MASPGNQNQQPVGGPFDVQRFLIPYSRPPITPTPNSTFHIPNPPYPPSYSVVSYPPPAVNGGPYSYAPQSPIYHPQFHIPSCPFQSENHMPLPPSNLQHQRFVPYPTPPLQPPSPNPNPNSNHGARWMALLRAPVATTIDNQF